jgi:polysaccharide deacetylase 2 family uncharacterized protein YibQ
MARRKIDKGRFWQVAAPAIALAAGCVLLVLALRKPDDDLPRPVLAPPKIATAAKPEPAARPAGPIHDPLTDEVKQAMAAEHEPDGAPPAVAPRPAPPQVAVVPVPPGADAPGGVPAWQRNAIHVDAEDGRPMIAIVLDDMGLDRRRADEAVTLPGPLTMSYMAYAKDLSAQTAEARAHGHELMLHIPMEPHGSMDPGPEALRVSLGDAEIERRVAWDLARIEGITGANNHMGSRFTESTHGMSLVLQQLNQRGLFFLDSRTSKNTVAFDVAKSMGMPRAKRDVFLDDDMASPAVASELAKTETVARRQGYAIAIGHPHDGTIAALKAWLPTVADKGFRLVPVSAVVAHNEAGRVEKVVN